MRNKRINYLQVCSLQFLVIAILIGCNHKLKTAVGVHIPEKSKEIQFKLEDSLGGLTFCVPVSYDTNFSWVNYSDCGKQCNERKYRFQPKTYKVIEESGYFWPKQLEESLNRFTITHRKYFPFSNGDTSKNIILHNFIKEQLKSDITNAPIIADTIEYIGDRYFSIFVMDLPSPLHVEKVLAETTIKGNRIKFEYELVTRKNDSIAKNFIRNSVELIKTIHIGKGV